MTSTHPNTTPPRRPGSRRSGHLQLQRGEIGAAAGIEMLLAVTTMMALVASVVGGGRMVDAQGQVNDAAYAAARAGSLAPGTPHEAARAAARNSLTERGRACTHLSVSLAGSDFGAGGQVTATVSCTADLADVTGLGIPGVKNYSGHAVVPIEQYRRPR